MRIAVVGAGAIGVTIAARLAQKGAEVILLDQAFPGGGTTSTSYAWINSNGKEPFPYFDINRAGLKAHKLLSPKDDSGWLGLGGHVEIAVHDPHVRDLRARISRLKSLGYGVEEVTREQASALLPDAVLSDDAQLIAHFTEEAYVYPAKYVAHMLGEARDAGVSVRTGCEVTCFRPVENAVEINSVNGSSICVDKVVSAVGRWTAGFAARAGVTVPVREFTEIGDIVVGYLAVTNPLPVRLSRLITSPWLNVRPAGGGRLMLQALDLDITANPNDVPAPASALGEAFLKRLRSLLANTEGARIDEIVVGQRAMPEDGRTIAGFVPQAPWLYVVATHSGLTLAPFLGEAVAEEIFGQRQNMLEAFRVERFFTDKTYGRPYAPRKPGEQ